MPSIMFCLQLEIKGLVEAMYGVQVERVSTINYLGGKVCAGLCVTVLSLPHTTITTSRLLLAKF